MSCGHQRVVFGASYLVVEHDFGGFGGHVEDVDATFHAVNDGLPILKRQLDKWCIVAIIGDGEVFQTIFGPESLACILEVKGVRAMPHHVHRVYFAKPYLYFFGCLKGHFFFF